MSEELDPELLAAELDALKEKATAMGIDFHPSIGYTKLAAKIKEAVEAVELATEAAAQAEEEPAPVAAPKAETKNQVHQRLKKEHSALVHVRITCMNPIKREWEGEYFSVSNRIVGTLTRMVPYNVVWHVPRIMLNVIRDRSCQVFHSVKNRQGQTIRVGKQIKEFAVEELPPLTQAELKDLAQRQAMSSGTAETA